MDKWPTLVDIQSVENGVAYAVVPGWDPHRTVAIRLEEFPEAIRPANGDTTRFYLAKVNLGAEKGENLGFEDFELAPDPVPENEL